MVLLSTKMPLSKSNVDNRLIGQPHKLVPFLIITMDRCRAHLGRHWPRFTRLLFRLAALPLLIPVPRNGAYIECLLNKELEFWNHVHRNA